VERSIYYTCREVCVCCSVRFTRSLRSRTSYSEVRGKASLALRGHRVGFAVAMLVVKLITPRFTPLLYISREKYLISRFLTKNLYKCGTPHKYIISKRTLRTRICILTLANIFIKGTHHTHLQNLTTGGRFFGGVRFVWVALCVLYKPNW
jgi:hypothetical protein